LDSTSGTNLAQSVRLNADDVSLSSGRISIALNNPGVLNPGTGLVLGGEAFISLQNSAKRLSLLSYSTIDTYGTGTVGSLSFEKLSLQAIAIRGFNTSGGTVSFAASILTLGNQAKSNAPGALMGPVSGSLTFDAERINLGANALRFEGFAQNSLQASGIVTESEGSLDSAGNLNLVTPFLTGANASNYQIRTVGSLRLSRPAAAILPAISSGFGAALTLQGANVAINGDISLSNGKLTLHATAGDLVIGDLATASLQVAGTKSTFVDTIRYTSGGTVNLLSDTGSVRLGTSASVNVSAQVGGGDAGIIQVKAPLGIFDLNGTISGTAGSSGATGAFSMDASSVANGSLAALDNILNAGGFTRSRDYRIRNGNIMIDGLATARNYRVAADSGSITVSSTINASGLTGGIIDLKAQGSLTLLGASRLDVSAQQFDAAGKGGSVTLEAGNQRNGLIDPAALLDLQSGSTINLSVASKVMNSEALGRFSGTLHLRAPRNAANSDLGINTIGSSVLGASSILVEGVKLYELTGAGIITTTLQNTVRSDANAFLGAADSTTAGYSAMLARLTALQPTLDLIIAPGVEIFNRSGDIVLGTATSTATSDWNLSTFRFGPRSTPGVLTLRASNNITFFNALSDGFSGGSSLWLSSLNQNNPLLPDNSESWSFRITAGSDFTAASFRSTAALNNLATGSGMINIGKNQGSATATGGRNATTASIIGNAFQVVRTGSGNIDLTAARTIHLLNPFASIYTAGTAVADPNKLFQSNDFTLPILTTDLPLPQASLGAAQQNYPAQYSLAGGNVSLFAGDAIERKTRNNSGLIDDSSRQVPMNWLYRRSYVDGTGIFGEVNITSGSRGVVDPEASTTWWVDFSNFFQSVGALGGGNISIASGGNINNIDAAIPTNYRAAAGRPSADSFVELGGGDLRITTGGDLSGGVYYLERGRATFDIGGAITTNATRSPSFGLVANLNNPSANILDSRTWLPTLLFAGKAKFDIRTVGDALIGPTYNPFLLPPGLNNRFWYKTYFSTFGQDSGTSVTSLSGDVVLRNWVTIPSAVTPKSVLLNWLDTQNVLNSSNNTAAWSQPWLRLGETTTAPFSTVLNLFAPSLSLTALSGDLILGGDNVLAPSRIGNLELLAAGSISGLNETGIGIALGRSAVLWRSSSFNVSDASPSSIPGINTPLNYFALVGQAANANSSTNNAFLNPLNLALSESGSFTGSNATIQVQQARHDSTLLHRGDPNPVKIFAKDGDISGLTLFSPKASRIAAGRDISDIGIYIQNLASTDISSVTAGRDIVSSDANSVLRVLSRSEGNQPANNESPLTGDIQVSGPGSLQVLAGRNIDLGTVRTNADGTGAGITSIGNFRNPFLQAEGADLVIGAGIGSGSSLSASSLAFQAFVAKYVKSVQGAAYLKEIAPGVDFDNLTPEEQAILALEIFYLNLRDTGRDYNNPESEDFRSYNRGFDAIATLFPESIDWAGRILTQSRDVRTRSGGDISIFAPGGGLSLANTTIGNPLAPPGIVTESGGSIAIFTDESVDIGIGRIFTLKGGNVAIWSSTGDIAAGSSSRTVQAAPPTRVVIDPQSATVETDLAGIATGGGIGVLASVEGVPAGDVDLIAPAGIIDAGDAGIRVTGNINLAAISVVNAGNISAGGNSVGVPSAGVSAPSIGTVTSASNSTAAAGATAVNPADRKTTEEPTIEDTALSLITVEVIGYGGGRIDEEEEEKQEEKAVESSSQ
jgi:hypothetical protein